MNTIPVTVVAAALALATASVLGQELTDGDRSELRERAERLQAQRQSDPGWDGGTRRLNESRGDVKLDQSRGDVKLDRRGDVKMRSTEGGARKREPIGRKLKRGVTKLPGALVRDRR